MHYISSYNPTASRLIYQYVKASNNITSTSGTFATMAGTSITVLEAGTYFINGDSEVSINASGVNNGSEIAIFRNGTVVSDTTVKGRIQASGLSLASIGWSKTIATNNTIELDAGDVVELRFRRSEGSATVTASNRSLRIIKAG